jgi:hypothetical protein
VVDDPPSVRFEDARDQSKQRAFTRAISPDHADRLAPMEVKRNTFERSMARAFEISGFYPIGKRNIPNLYQYVFIAHQKGNLPYF